ncbi:hypothetical protein, partial [Ramlibacter sp. WS9]|uniref:hypothetical protein n=1 Tax=Ramlibacter sp. WS9 TaxID=1882741 RepID=UPI00116ECD62
FGNALGSSLAEANWGVGQQAQAGLQPGQLGSGSYFVPGVDDAAAPEFFTDNTSGLDRMGSPKLEQPEWVDNWREQTARAGQQPTVGYRSTRRVDDAGNTVYDRVAAYAPLDGSVKYDRSVSFNSNTGTYIESWRDWPTTWAVADASGQPLLPTSHTVNRGTNPETEGMIRQVYGGSNERLAALVSNAEDRAVENGNFPQYLAAQFFPRSVGGAVLTAAGGPVAGLGLKGVGALALTRSAPLALRALPSAGVSTGLRSGGASAEAAAAMHPGRLAAESGDVSRASLIRALRQAETPESLATAKLLSRGKLDVKIFAQDPSKQGLGGLYRFGTKEIELYGNAFSTPAQAAGYATHEATHFMQGLSRANYNLGHEFQAFKNQGAVDLGHWSRSLSDNGLYDLLSRHPVYRGVRPDPNWPW